MGRKKESNGFQIATARTARDINRRIILNLIRKLQPVTRADLARHTRLQRSTVSAITEQLIAERWVTTGALGDLPRGRKPTFLHLNGDRAAILGVDIRPTETAMAVADLSMKFLSQETMRTNDDPGEFIQELCKRISHTIKSYPRVAFEGIGVALPGRVELASGKLVFAPNLAWKSVDLKTPLQEATGLSVQLENAANACALAEFCSGRHSEAVRNVLAVTVSEGIGVGMVLNGQLVRGSTGLAGEFGHVTLVEDGPLCRCGNRGCWEAFASNTAAVRYYRDTADSPATVRSFKDLLHQAEKGDLPARAAIERMAHHLGAGIAMLITGFAPDVVVVCGEIAQAWDRVGEVIAELLAQRLPTPSSTRIVPADVVTQPRLRGVIAMMLQEHFSVPSVAWSL